jgi:hypothetical protein
MAVTSSARENTGQFPKPFGPSDFFVRPSHPTHVLLHITQLSCNPNSVPEPAHSLSNHGANGSSNVAPLTRFKTSVKYFPHILRNSCKPCSTVVDGERYIPNPFLDTVVTIRILLQCLANMSGNEIQPLFPTAPFAEYRFITIVAISSGCMGLAWFAAILRMISRGYILRSIGLDDILMLVSLVCLSLLTALSTLIRGFDTASLFHNVFHIYRFSEQISQQDASHIPPNDPSSKRK